MAASALACPRRSVSAAARRVVVRTTPRPLRRIAAGSTAWRNTPPTRKRPDAANVGRFGGARCDRYFLAANFPRSVFTNRASARFSLISLVIAEYTVVTMLPKAC
jgi:hypothetical protein